MKKGILISLILSAAVCMTVSCGSKTPNPAPKEDFKLSSVSITGTGVNANKYTGVSVSAPINLNFSVPVDRATVAANIQLVNTSSIKQTVSFAYLDQDKTVQITLPVALQPSTDYSLYVQPGLKSANGTSIATGRSIAITTAASSGPEPDDKFPRISDEELLTKVQQKTFRYFWDNAHPTSGMAPERTTTPNTVTSGGTGFGIMAIVVGVERGFVSRSAACERIQKIVTFLADKCTDYHGVFAHWINGTTGATIPFSTNDNGGDLVETSFLMQGLLTARQYFDGEGAEKTLRDGINALWEAVEWDWYRRSGQEVLYWHWSPDKQWTMNHQIRGWNECMITYVLAASSTTHTIPASVFQQGWAQNGSIVENKTTYGYPLPMGGQYGGPMFFAHYSFMGLDPRGLKDIYNVDYWTQNVSHAKINYSYCVENPKGYTGYSADCWGLTASDGNTGYSAHSPTNDKGVIAPTAALASMPYTTTESMRALRYFYYKIGDKLWTDSNGFKDAFNLTANWYDNDHLAIDQGPIVVMIENYRTGLIWDLFMSCPEVTAGLNKLGFTITSN